MRAAPFLLSLALVFAAARSEAGNARRDSQRKAQAMQPTRSLVYKTINGARLQLHVFEPEGHKPSDRRPAIVFFFGGGWTGGGLPAIRPPTQFYPQCKYLASRGMVAISAEYRVKGTHGVSPFECVTDGKSAVRWVRAHAAELGIDPNRLASGGGSAGSKARPPSTSSDSRCRMARRAAGRKPFHAEAAEGAEERKQRRRDHGVATQERLFSGFLCALCVSV